MPAHSILPSRSIFRSAAIAGVGLFGGTGCWGWAWDEGEWDQTYPDVEGIVVVHNANDVDLGVYVRPLRPELLVDCSRVADDPAALLREHAFGDAVHWSLPPGTNLGVGSEFGCGAAWVGGEAVPPQILFWFDGETSRFPGEYDNLSELDPEASAIVREGSITIWQGGEGIRSTPPVSPPAIPDSCVTAPAGRLDWDLHLPMWRPLGLLASEFGPDGCFELELLDYEDHPNTHTVYLCIPDYAFPFEVDEAIRFEPLAIGQGLAIRLLDPTTFDLAIDDDGRYEREVELFRATADLEDVEFSLQHDLQPAPRVSCPWQADDSCATTQRPFDVRVAESGLMLAAGDDPVAFSEPGYVREFSLVHGGDRAVLDAACGVGSDNLGPDIDAVVISRVAE